MRALSSRGVPFAITFPWSITDDVVGQVVRLVEVLGREQHRRAVVDELADEAPDVVARLRVEPGRGLVEDQQARAADEARAEVEPAAHATRVAAHDPVAGLDEAESLERLAGAPPRLAGFRR